MLQRSDGADLDTRSSGAYPDPLISLEKTHEGNRILCVDISPDDEYAAIGLINGSVIIYDLDTRDMVKVLHPGLWVWDVEWCPVDSRNLLAVSTGKNWDITEGWLKIYSTSSWKLVEEKKYDSQISSISWKSDGSLIAVPDNNQLYLIWTNNWTLKATEIFYSNFTWAVEWQPQGDLLAVGKMSFDFGEEGGSVDILDTNDDFSVFSHIGPFSFTPDILRWDRGNYNLGIGNLSLEVWDVHSYDLSFTQGSPGEVWIRGWEWANGVDGFFVANNTKVEFFDKFHPWNYMYIDLPGYILGISLSSNNSVLLAIAYDTLYFLDIQGMEPSPPTDNDTDGDGVLDINDDFPTDPAASEDSDGDGYPGEWNIGRNESDSTTGLKLDEFPSDPNEWADSDDDSIGDNGDGFPYDPAASVDSDGDGYPDEWNPGMSENDSTTGLKLDEFPMDSTEWVDTDRDGRGDNSDVFPHDPGEWADTDEDGVGNNGDAFPTDPAASVDTDGDRLPDKWNPGMSEADSTTGLKLDRYPLDPKNLPDRNNSLLSSPWTYLPIILITLTVIFTLAVVMIVRGRKISNQHLNGEEERIRRYREGILNGLDDPDFEITDEELIEALSRKRKSGEISDETLTYIIENVVGDR
ncbi:MAG: hypothetical protein ACMUHU_04305 [Thermoplasmatota archaeon]